MKIATSTTTCNNVCAEAVIQRNRGGREKRPRAEPETQADRSAHDLTADGSLSIRERDAALASAAQGSANIDQAKATLETHRRDLQTAIVNRAALEADVENAVAVSNQQIDPEHPHRRPARWTTDIPSCALGAYGDGRNPPHHLVPPQHWVIVPILYETQLANLRVGQPVKFTVDALNDKAYEGRVQSISRPPGWSSAPLPRITPRATSSRSPSVFRCASRCSETPKRRRGCARGCRYR